MRSHCPLLIRESRQVPGVESCGEKNMALFYHIRQSSTYPLKQGHCRSVTLVCPAGRDRVSVKSGLAPDSHWGPRRLQRFGF